MDRDAALDILPAAYARALRLRDAGVADDEIAQRLALDAAALTTLFEVAERKLRRAMRLP